jgi:small GTP-binding protein
MEDNINFNEELSESELLASNFACTKRKLLILGGQEVGKTSILKRFKNNNFIEDYEPTIQQITRRGINFNNEYVYLEIMDLEGQTEYTIFSPNKFSFGYNGYILVYDVKNSKSFELIKFIYEQINILSGNAAKILVGTKCDKDLDSSSKYEKQVSSIEGKKFAEKIHCPFLEVSSKDYINIDEIFRILLIEINKTESGINLNNMKCVKIFKFFLHHPKLMIYCFYINLFIILIFSIILFFLGIYKEVIPEKKDNYYFGIGFPFIIFGIWGIIINVGGIIGMKNKDIYLLRLNYIGLIYGGIFDLISLCNYIIINIFNKELTFSKLFGDCTYLLIIALIPLIIGIILSKIYKVLFQKDLKSYMA